MISRSKKNIFIFISGLLVGGIFMFSAKVVYDFYIDTKNNYGVESEFSKETAKMSSLINNDDSRIFELVNKNSKLEEDYIPNDLVYPDVKTVIPGKDNRNLLRRCAAEALQLMFSDAKKEGVTLYLFSGFRAYGTQDVIYKASLKKSSPEYVAKPGESEHQTGLAADIVGNNTNVSLDDSFADTVAGKWLKENAYKYGFILRYPKDKENITGYRYEPWHYRYVGRDLAYYLNKDNLTIEEFYNKIK